MKAILTFKYNHVVYYLNVDPRIKTVTTEHYDNIEIRLPKGFSIPKISENTSFDEIRKIEQSLETDNVRYYDLQLYLKSIDWQLEQAKQILKDQIDSFVSEYGEENLPYNIALSRN